MFHTSDNDYELINCVTNWLKSLATEFCEEGMKKLVKHYDKCVEIEGIISKNSKEI